MAHSVALPDGFTISDDRAGLPMAFVHDALSDAYWMAERSREQTERAWAHCLPPGVYGPDGAPVGCARILTDYALHAHLADLVIRPTHRGGGLRKALVEAALTHPELATVIRWTLSTTDAHGLYAWHGLVQDGSDPASMILRGPGTGAAAMR